MAGPGGGSGRLVVEQGPFPGGGREAAVGSWAVRRWIGRRSGRPSTFRVTDLERMVGERAWRFWPAPVDSKEWEKDVGGDHRDGGDQGVLRGAGVAGRARGRS